MLDIRTFFLLLFISAILQFIDMAHAETIDSYKLGISGESEKQYNLSIGAIFKNEAGYLKEWIEYHRQLGIDHFYLYDLGSKDSSQVILKPYIKNKIVTLMNWPEMIPDQEYETARWALSTQISAYENARAFVANGETKWLLFIDINEFLACPKGKLIDVLEKYDNFAGISLSSDFLDASVLNMPLKKKSLIHALELPTSPPPSIDRMSAKIIFRPDECAGFDWPPYQCRFKSLQSSVEVDREELYVKCYLNRYSEKKLKHKNFFDTQIKDQIEITEATREIHPIYHHIPNFLKRIRQKMSEEDNVTLNKNHCR